MGNTAISSSSISKIDQFLEKSLTCEPSICNTIDSKKYSNYFYIWEKKDITIPYFIRKNNNDLNNPIFSNNSSYIVLNIKDISIFSTLNDIIKIPYKNNSALFPSFETFTSNSIPSPTMSIKEAYKLLDIPCQDLLSALGTSFNSNDLIYPINSDSIILNDNGSKYSMQVFVWTGLDCNEIEAASAHSQGLELINFISQKDTQEALCLSLNELLSWTPLLSIFNKRSNSTMSTDSLNFEKPQPVVASIASKRAFSDISQTNKNSLSRSSSFTSENVTSKPHLASFRVDVSALEFPEFISQSPCFREPILLNATYTAVEVIDSISEENLNLHTLEIVQDPPVKSPPSPTNVKHVLSLAERRYRRSQKNYNSNHVSPVTTPGDSSPQNSSNFQNPLTNSIDSLSSLTLQNTDTAMPTHTFKKPPALKLSMGLGSAPTSPGSDFLEKPKPAGFRLSLPLENITSQPSPENEILETVEPHFNQPKSLVINPSAPFSLSLSMPSARSNSSRVSTPRDTWTYGVMPPGPPIKFSSEEEYENYMMKSFEEEDVFNSEYEKKQAKMKFFGGSLVANDKVKLKKYGITHVLNCAADVCPNYFENDVDEYGKPSFKYKKLFLLDANHEDITCVFYEVIDFFQNAFVQNPSNKIFVHCHRGVSRSATLVIVWLMYSLKLNYNSAFEYTKKRRGITNPNIGFVYQLIDWHKRVTSQWMQPSLYRIAPHNTRDHTFLCKVVDKVEVNALDSRGVFILCAANLVFSDQIINLNDIVYIWIGKLAHPKYMEQWLNLANMRIKNLQDNEYVSKNVVTLREGSEYAHFWEVLNSCSKVKSTRSIGQTNMAYKDYDLIHTVPVVPTSLISARGSVSLGGSLSSRIGAGAGLLSDPSPRKISFSRGSMHRMLSAPLSNNNSLNGNKSNLMSFIAGSGLENVTPESFLDQLKALNDNPSANMSVNLALPRKQSHFSQNSFIPSLAPVPATPTTINEVNIDKFSPRATEELKMDIESKVDTLPYANNVQSPSVSNPGIDEFMMHNTLDLDEPTLFDYPSFEKIDLFDANDLSENGVYVLVWHQSIKGIADLDSQQEQVNEHGEIVDAINPQPDDDCLDFKIFHIWVWIGNSYEMEMAFESDYRLFADTLKNEFVDFVGLPNDIESLYKTQFEKSGNESNEFWKVFYFN